MVGINGYGRIVIKIGSSLLVDRRTGLKQAWLKHKGHMKGHPGYPLAKEIVTVALQPAADSYTNLQIAESAVADDNRHF